jgi:hypothetical protein
LPADIAVWRKKHSIRQAFAFPERSMSDFSHADVERGSWLSLDGWAFLAATIFLLMIIVGILPAVPG